MSAQVTVTDRVGRLNHATPMLMALNTIGASLDLQAGLYVHLLVHAGTRMTAVRLAEVITNALVRFSKDREPLVGVLLLTIVDQFVDAMTADEQVRAECKAILNERIDLVRAEQSSSGA